MYTYPEFKEPEIIITNFGGQRQVKIKCSYEDRTRLENSSYGENIYFMFHSIDFVGLTVKPCDDKLLFWLQMTLGVKEIKKW